MELWQMFSLVLAMLGCAVYVGVDLAAIRRLLQQINEKLDQRAEDWTE